MRFIDKTFNTGQAFIFLVLHHGIRNWRNWIFRLTSDI